MEKEIPHIETRYDDLAGAVSINFTENEDFNTFAYRVARVDLDKYQPVFLKVYIDKSAIVTIYALDKVNYLAHKEQTGKLLVRKYKVSVSVEELFTHFRQIQFSLVAGNYDVNELDVIQ